MQINQGCCSHIGRRKNQQDDYGFSDFSDTTFIAHGGILAVVCDGMGGLEKGEEAARLAVKTILDGYMAKAVEESVTEALDNAIMTANREIVQLGLQTGNVGTTLVLAVVYKDELYWRTAGDSRIYLLHDNKLAQLSTDHTYAQELAQNEVSLEEAANHLDGNALVSYLGVGEDIDFDRNKLPVKLQSGDVLLLCSDGVFNSLNDAEIIDALRDPNAMKAALELQHKVLDKQLTNQDNSTAIVLRLQVENDKKRHYVLVYALFPFVIGIATVLIGYLFFINTLTINPSVIKPVILLPYQHRL